MLYNPAPLLSLSELWPGRKVCAHGSDGLWWDGEVVGKHGEGDDAFVNIKYNHFGTRYNESFMEVDAGISDWVSPADPELELARRHYPEQIHLRLPDGTWQIEKLHRMRMRNGRREYLVRWKVRSCLPLRLPCLCRIPRYPAPDRALGCCSPHR